MKLIAHLLPLALASYPDIAGYECGSDVTSHNALDIDQKEMEDALKGLDYTLAKDVYTNGGNSGGYAELTTSALASAISKDTILKVGTITGKAKSSAAIGDTKVKMYYGVGPQDTTCTRAAAAGCVPATGTLQTSTGVSLATYTDVTNKYRTLQGFSLQAKDKMTGQKFFDEATAYHETTATGTYSDDLVLTSLDGTTGPGGNKDVARTQLIKKGSVFLGVWMYVIRELEDAVDDCTQGDIAANDGAVHAWDEGVAFYTGTLEGEDAPGKDTSTGKMLHNLADKRCSNYGTCTNPWSTAHIGDAFNGGSEVNEQVFELFAIGRTHMQRGECTDGAAIKNEIVKFMTIPMIQGLLRYAYKVAVLGGGAEEAAEGHVFAMAALPRINSVSATAATTIKTNMLISATKFDAATGLMADGFLAVWEAVQEVLPGLGLSCTDIGGLAESKTTSVATTTYYEDFAPCLDIASSTPSAKEIAEAMNTPILIGCILFAVIAILAAVGWCMSCSKTKELQLKLGGVAGKSGV